MKVNCEIVLDTLPMYVDEMVSAPTAELVDSHLQQCVNCCRALEAINSAKHKPHVFSDDSKKRLTQGIHRSKLKKWLNLITALCLILTLLCGLLVLCTVPVWLTAEEAELKTEETIANMIRISTGENTYKLRVVAPNMPHSDKDLPMGICCYGFRCDWLYKQQDLNPFVAYDGQTIWYRGDLAGETDTLILGDATNTLENLVEKESKLNVYPYGNSTILHVFWLSLGFGIACLAGAWGFRKTKLGSYLRNFGILMLCCCVSCLFVTSGRMIGSTEIYSEIGSLRRYVAIVTVTTLLWASVSCIVYQFKYKTEKKYKSQLFD